jgi:hypothetical protein
MDRRLVYVQYLLSNYLDVIVMWLLEKFREYFVCAKLLVLFSLHVVAANDTFFIKGYINIVKILIASSLCNKEMS